MFPNPSRSVVTISFPNDSKSRFELQVYDLMGNQVRSVSNITGNFLDTEANFGSFTLTATGIINFFIAKINSAGIELWAETMATGDNGFSKGNSITLDESYNVYTTGRFRETTTVGALTLYGYEADQNMFILKFDSFGNPLWGINEGIEFVGEEGYEIAAGNNKLYVSGYYQFDSTEISGNTIYGHPNPETSYFTVKYDYNGNFGWVQQLNNTGFISSHEIATDEIGAAYINLSFQDSLIFPDTSYISSGNYDLFMMKLDTNGNILWKDHYGGSNLELTGNNNLALDSSNNIYLSGIYLDTLDLEDTMLFSSSGINFFLTKFVLDSGPTSSIEDISEMIQRVQIFPNPAEEIITVVCQQPGILLMLDLSGQVIKEIMVNQTREIIVVSGLPRGVYLLKFSNKKGISTDRIILQ